MRVVDLHGVDVHEQADEQADEQAVEDLARPEAVAVPQEPLQALQLLEEVGGRVLLAMGEAAQVLARHRDAHGDVTRRAAPTRPVEDELPARRDAREASERTSSPPSVRAVTPWLACPRLEP